MIVLVCNSSCLSNNASWCSGLDAQPVLQLVLCGMEATMVTSYFYEECESTIFRVWFGSIWFSLEWRRKETPGGFLKSVNRIMNLYR